MRVKVTKRMSLAPDDSDPSIDRGDLFDLKFEESNEVISSSHDLRGLWAAQSRLNHQDDIEAGREPSETGARHVDRPAGLTAKDVQDWIKSEVDAWMREENEK